MPERGNDRLHAPLPARTADCANEEHDDTDHAGEQEKIEHRDPIARAGA